MRFYKGIVEKNEELISIKIKKRFQLWFDKREEDKVVVGDWWCEPRKRYCYGEIDFKRWKGTLEAEQEISVKKEKLISAKSGAVSFANKAIAEACPRLLK